MKRLWRTALALCNRRAIATKTSRFCFQKTKAPKTLRIERAPKPLKARRVGPAGLGTIAIPGVGPFIAAGPIMAALAGAGVGGTVGGLTGALIGAGIPEYEAKRFEGRIKDGGILVSVHCDNSEWTSRAKDILEKTGAQDVSSAGEASADFAETDKPLPRDASGTVRRRDDV
jgi:hypothetical protein